MIPASVSGARHESSADAAPIVEAEGWAKAGRWALGAIELLGVGLLVPIAMIVLLAPIGIAIRLVLWAAGLS